MFVYLGMKVASSCEGLISSIMLLLCLIFGAFLRIRSLFGLNGFMFASLETVIVGIFPFGVICLGDGRKFSKFVVLFVSLYGTG